MNLLEVKQDENVILVLVSVIRQGYLFKKSVHEDYTPDEGPGEEDVEPGNINCSVRSLALFIF